MTKIRLIALCATPVLIALGLASRAAAVPAFVRAHAGDALYAALIYALVSAAAPCARLAARAGWALAICFAIEGLQAVDAGPASILGQIRALPGAHLVLGREFLLADLVRMAFGVCMVAGAEIAADFYGRRPLAQSRPPA